MERSGQNLTNYMTNNILVPIRKNAKGNLYTKGNIYRWKTIDYVNAKGTLGEDLK